MRERKGKQKVKLVLKEKVILTNCFSYSSRTLIFFFLLSQSFRPSLLNNEFFVMTLWVCKKNDTCTNWRSRRRTRGTQLRTWMVWQNNGLHLRERRILSLWRLSKICFLSLQIYHKLSEFLLNNHIYVYAEFATRVSYRERDLLESKSLH